MDTGVPAIAVTDIRPARFVTLVSSRNNGFSESALNGVIFGVSGLLNRDPNIPELSYGASGLLAKAGEEFTMHRKDSHPITLGATVARGQRLKSDATGRGIAAVTIGDEYGGIALQSGVVGEIIQFDFARGKLS